MDEKNVFGTGLCGDLEDRARSLIRSTLTPVAPDIEIVDFNLDYVQASSPASISYGCTILVKTGDSSVIRVGARDCDEVLAVYKATTALLDQLPLIEKGKSANRPTPPW